MLLWVVLTIVAAMMWALGNIIDKFVIFKYFQNPYLAVSFNSLFCFIASIVIFFSVGITIPEFNILLLAILVGVLYSFVNLFYFKSLFVEEVSRVIPMFTLVPLFVLLLAIFVLNEIFTLPIYVGIVLLVIGAFAISWERGETKFKLSKSFWFMLIADIIFAIPILGLKYELSYMTPESALFWAGIGMLITLPFFLAFSYKRLKDVYKKQPKSILYISISSVILIFGLYILFSATNLTEVSLISALGQTQMFFVLIFATILSIFKPNIIKEEVTRRDIIEKVLAIIALFAGVVLIL